MHDGSKGAQATNTNKRVRTLQNMIKDQCPILAAKFFADALEGYPMMSAEERVISRKVVKAIRENLT